MVEWICAQHWAVIDKAKRRVYARALRRARQDRKSREAVDRLWSIVKRQAIERGLGL